MTGPLPVDGRGPVVTAKPGPSAYLRRRSATRLALQLEREETISVKGALSDHELTPIVVVERCGKPDYSWSLRPLGQLSTLLIPGQRRSVVSTDSEPRW